MWTKSVFFHISSRSLLKLKYQPLFPHTLVSYRWDVLSKATTQGLDQALLACGEINSWLLIIAWAQIGKIISSTLTLNTLTWRSLSWSLTFASAGLNNKVDEDQQPRLLVSLVDVQPLVHYRLQDYREGSQLKTQASHQRRRFTMMVPHLNNIRSSSRPSPFFLT